MIIDLQGSFDFIRRSSLGTHSLLKDFILISALLISLAACVYAFIRHRKTQESMNLMMKELETLQQAEGNLMAVTGK